MVVGAARQLWAKPIPAVGSLTSRCTRPGMTNRVILIALRQRRVRVHVSKIATNPFSTSRVESTEAAMNPKHIRGLSSMWVDPVSQEKSIQRQIVRMITVRSFALVVLLGVAWQAQATGRQNTVSEHGPA